MSCKCAKFHSFITKGTIFTSNCWTIWREGSKINYYYTSYTGPVTGTYRTFSRKKKCKRNVTKEKSPAPIISKKEQTNKLTKKAKTKQNKSLVSISNDGDQLWLGLVLNLSQASADLQQRADLPCWRSDLPDVLIFPRCFFNNVHSWFSSNQKR